MKVRSGFVSNSSSSSFLIGLAIVDDYDMFFNWMNHHEIKLGGDIDLYHIQDLFEKNKFMNCSTVSMGSHKDVLVAKLDHWYTTLAIEVPSDKLDKNLLVLHYYGNEGDDSFWDEHVGVMQYDVSLDYFNDKLTLLYNTMLSEPGSIGLINSQGLYGAGRDG